VRAVVYDRYGPPEVLRLAEIPRPAPKDGDVLVRVRAAAVNRTDTGLRSAEYFISRFVTGLTRPKRKLRIPGTELAGEVEAVGPAVTEFAVGDRVFGVSSKTAGTWAEYVALPESTPIAHMPGGMTFEEAAAVPDGAILAMSILRAAGKRPKVLIYGASGSIGTAGVQLAKHFGAEVTAVCSTRSIEVVASLGPDRVIDYERERFTGGGETYDFFSDAVGKLSFKQARGSLARGGVYISTDLGPYQQNPFLAISTKVFGDRRVMFPIPRYRKQDVLFLRGLIESGEYRAVIDRRYPLEDVVEANRYVETGQKTGNVVLMVSHDRTT
jgi:NADPH:quinone reductase-like Zn-dependent oxidoreductase